MIKHFRWCAYDTDFHPNKSDKRFQMWNKKGLTTYHSFTHKGTLQDFQSLQTKFGLEQADFFRFLQMRDYFNKHCKCSNLSAIESDFLKILKSAHATWIKKAISKLYNGMLNARQHNTLHIKYKWEHEAESVITVKDWAKICIFQWTSTSSLGWREHCWKNIIRFFSDTPPEQI